MPDVKLRDPVPGYRRHTRAHTYTSYKGDDPTDLHSFGFTGTVQPVLRPAIVDRAIRLHGRPRRGEAA